MRNFRKHKTAIFLISATLLIAIFIGIFGAVASNEMASLAENAVGSAAEPGQTAASGIRGWFRNIFAYFGSVKSLREENAALKQSNIELDKQVRDMMGLEEENQQLRAMLDLFEAEADLDLIAAQVIAKDPSNWYSSFTINRGTKDGIEKNQAVFTGNGELIGQVYKVGGSWAEIITIVDPDSGVGSMVQRTKDIGVLEGDSSLRMKGLCRLGYLSRDTDVAVGDYVETSGMGGIYPRGLLIGKVTEVIEDNATMSKYATVEPLADIDRVTEVFVLKSYTEEIKAVVQPDEKKKNEKDPEEEEDTNREESAESEESTSSASSASSSDTGTGSGTKPATRPAETPRPAERPTSPAPAPTPAPATNTGGATGSLSMNGSELTE